MKNQTAKSALERRIGMPSTATAILLTMLAATGGAAPPDPAPPAVDAGSTSIQQRAHGVATVDGRLLGLGPDFRAEFLDDGIRFTPALGRKAPRSFPLTYRFESIARGANVIVDARTPAQSFAQESAVVYVHSGPGVTVEERYDVRPEGVEQSFVLDHRPAGAGDLRVRGRIETDLLPRPAAAGVSFEVDDLGGVSFGAVTVYDAAGRSVAGTLSVEGDRIDIVVPGPFVDRAVYPLVIDPLIGSIISIGVGWDDLNPDVAYDASNDVYLVVWQREFSGADIDIRMQRVSGAGVLVSGVNSLTSSDVNLNPTVANVNLRDRFLVCWQTGPSIFGPWDIEGRSVTASSGAQSGTVSIAATSAFETDPDAGGESTLSDDEAIVVWDSGNAIDAVQVTLPAAGNPIVGIPWSVASGGYQDGRPAISKSGGSNGRFLMVWQREFAGDQGVDIRAALFDRDGAAIDSFHSVTSTMGVDEVYPDVDGDGAQWMVVYQRQESADDSNHDIICEGIEYSGQLVSGPENPVEADTSDNEIQPAVGWLGDRYAASWSDESASPFIYALAYKMFAEGSCIPCGPETTFASGANFQAGSEIASERSGGGTGDGALLAFLTGNEEPPFDGDVNAQLLEGIGAGGAVTVEGGGCGVSGNFTAVGASAVGNANFQLQFTGGDPAAPTALLNLNLAQPPIPCASCQITPILFLIGLPMVGGNVTVPLPIPCDVTFFNLNIEAQLIMQNTSQTRCYQVGTGVSFSDRLRFQIGQ